MDKETTYTVLRGLGLHTACHYTRSLAQDSATELYLKYLQQH